MSDYSCETVALMVLASFLIFADIWSRLLCSAILSLWYSRFEVTWLLRDHSKRKPRVRFVYVLPEVLHGDFLSEIKYFVNLEWDILQILTINVIFFYRYSNWGELSFNIFKFFMWTNWTHVLLLKWSLKSHVTSKREYHNDKIELADGSQN